MAAVQRIFGLPGAGEVSATVTDLKARVVALEAGGGTGGGAPSVSTADLNAAMGPLSLTEPVAGGTVPGNGGSAPTISMSDLEAAFAGA